MSFEFGIAVKAVTIPCPDYYALKWQEMDLFCETARHIGPHMAVKAIISITSLLLEVNEDSVESKGVDSKEAIETEHPREIMSRHQFWDRTMKLRWQSQFRQ